MHITAFTRYFLLSLICVCLLFPAVSLAADIPNNKVGIHISDINEVPKASELVNSNGGEWGYVSMVINSNDRQRAKWQERMNLLNEKKLIPIVRIATYGNGPFWTVPVADDARDWAQFLNSLYWPTQKKIVVVYNEPNHGNEWGGSTNPSEYSRVLSATADALHEADPHFVVLNAGFDASTPQQPPAFMDQVAYMDQMEQAVPGIFNKLDGWASHSYPNPGFSGSVDDTGRGSVRTYEWELELLRTRYNVTKELPVYITETGWVSKNADHPRLKYSDLQTAVMIQKAFEKIWLPDSRVRAVTPFMLTYKQPQFSHFSWLNPDDTPTPSFTAIQSLPKITGRPLQDYKSVITTVDVPPQIQKGREFIATIAMKNIGNAIWQDRENIILSVDDPQSVVIRNEFSSFRSSKILPGQTHIYRFTIYRNDLLRRAQLSFQMRKDSEPFGEKLFIPIKIFQPPTLTLATLNPPKEPIPDASLRFSNSRESDVVADVVVPQSSGIGTYTSYAFVPGEEVLVELFSPNRDPSRVKVKIDEGGNFASLSLTEPYPFWKRIFQRVNGLSSSLYAS